MHPAYSVIFFTTASGAGYGLLAVMGVFGATGLVPPDRWLGVTGFVVALGLVTVGLLSSTFHLGHPERAWRAYSQWRSSWLSREGVLATAAYVPALIYAIGWVFYESTGGGWGLLGVVTAVFATLTVYATGMIYATLRPIHAWCNQWTVLNYLALSLLTGSLLLNALAHSFSVADPQIALLVVVSLFLAFYLKRRYWRFIDQTRSASTVESATGLGGIGKTRLLDPPNTQENFVQQEMGYKVARKHAMKLRRIAFISLFAAPFVFTSTGMEAAPVWGLVLSLLSVVAAAIGIVIERWLFFAEARHAVSLYYGADAA